MTGRGKILAGLFTLAVLYTFAPVTDTKADDTDTNTNTITDVYGSYTVTIPAEVSLNNGTDTSQETLNVSGSLNPYHDLDISIKSQSNYQLKCGNAAELKYEISGDGVTDSSDSIKKISYTAEAGANDFSTDIKLELNNAEPTVSGTYTDTLTFTMDCRVKNYTLTLNANGGDITGTDTSRTIAYNSAYGELPTPTRTGYKFGGWFTAETDGTQVNANTLMQGADTTIYAHWTPITYTIKYDNNSAFDKGASGSMDASPFTYDQPGALKANTFTNSNTGATFRGWNTEADGTGTAYNENASVTNWSATDGDVITLYAQWEYQQTVNVEYEKVEDDTFEDTKTVLREWAVMGSTVSWSTKELNWSGDAEKCWKATSISYTVEGETENTVKIYRNQYRLDLNGALEESKNIEGNLRNYGTAAVYINGKLASQENATDYWVLHKYGTKYKIELTSEGTGYTYVGKMEDGTINSANSKVIEGTVTGGIAYISSEEATKGQKLYKTSVTLVFRRHRYTIEYKGNEATGGNTESSKHGYDVEKNLSSNGFTREGYTFTGWNTKADGTDTSYTDEQPVKNLTAEDGATITLYAQWTKNEQTTQSTEKAQNLPTEETSSADNADKQPVTDNSDDSDTTNDSQADTSEDTGATESAAMTDTEASSQPEAVETVTPTPEAVPEASETEEPDAGASEQNPEETE